jgi:hypothetical protein
MKFNWNYPQNWLMIRQKYYLSMIELPVATHGHDPSEIKKRYVSVIYWHISNFALTPRIPLSHPKIYNFRMWIERIIK